MPIQHAHPVIATRRAGATPALLAACFASTLASAAAPIKPTGPISADRDYSFVIPSESRMRPGPTWEPAIYFSFYVKPHAERQGRMICYTDEPPTVKLTLTTRAGGGNMNPSKVSATIVHSVDDDDTYNITAYGMTETGAPPTPEAKHTASAEYPLRSGPGLYLVRISDWDLPLFEPGQTATIRISGDVTDHPVAPRPAQDGFDCVPIQNGK